MDEKVIHSLVDWKALKSFFKEHNKRNITIHIALEKDIIKLRWQLPKE